MMRNIAHAVLGVITAGCFAACERSAPAVAPGLDPEAAPSVDRPSASSPPVLTRAALLAAVAAAASDAASGVARTGPSGLNGRLFRLKIAFGCRGEDTPPPGIDPVRDGVARWSRPAGRENLRLSLSPADWSDGDPSGAAPPGFDTIEGAWIPYPWMMGEGCPASGLPMMDERMPRIGPSAGLAMVRGEGGSRLGRAGSGDFSYVVRGQDGAPAPAPADGYRLVIEGRLTAWADGRVIRCRVIWSDEPPICVIGAAVGRIALEDATGTRLSEWRPG